MELKFPQLIATNVLRLKRPVFDYGENPVLPMTSKALMENDEELLNMNDVGQSGAGVLDILTVPMPSWRLYVGETLKVLLCVTSQNHDLQKVNLKVNVNTMKTVNYEKTLVQEFLELIPRGTARFVVLTIPLEFPESYLIKVQAEYTSKAFYEDLKSQTANFSVEPPLVGTNFRINSKTKQVFRKFSKRYKIQAKEPFSITQNVILSKDKKFLQIRMKNIATSSFFIQHLYLIPQSNIFVKDLNFINGKSIFNDCVDFTPNAERTYLFELNFESKSPSVSLGNIEIKWKTYLGYPGTIVFPNVSCTMPMPEGIKIEVLEPSTNLQIEVPVFIKLKISNISQEILRNVKLGSTSTKSMPLAIISLKTTVIKEILIGGSETVDILVMPKLPGIHHLDNFWICDMSGKTLIKDPKIGPFKVEFQ